MTKAIGIYREFKLAGKPGPDQRILDLTAEELKKRGFEVLTKKPEDFKREEIADLIFTMARGEEINELLIEKEKKGIFVINSPEDIRFSFNRKLTYQKMKELGVNVPETKTIRIEALKFSNLKDKSILKPSNRHEFWFVIENENDFKKAKKEYKNQRIEEIIVQKFINGKHIKYYVIGEEVILPKNVENEISPEAIEGIKKQARLTGEATGLKIFGGDFIVENDIPFCVDANDWPSMGSIEGFTQEQAAVKIAAVIENEYNNFKRNR
ncbi:MAG: ATP-grasp domain-containing protein [Patescibacteria group bacterium]|nr:ATP-grasp domain-containing protein [Patescibacteria group bacterium]